MSISALMIQLLAVLLVSTTDFVVLAVIYGLVGLGLSVLSIWLRKPGPAGRWPCTPDCYVCLVAVPVSGGQLRSRPRV